MGRGQRLLLSVASLALASSAFAAEPAATLSPNQFELLVSREVAGLQWLIALDVQTGEVSGNVFDPKGGDPQFVRCSPTGLRGSDLLYRCVGARDCNGADCAQEWQPIADDLSVPISYFRAGTFQRSPEALLGPPPYSGSPDYSTWHFARGVVFVELVTRDGVPAVRGGHVTAPEEVFAKAVGDGVAAFQYEMLDDVATFPTCDLYRFNQLGPATIAGVRLRARRAADGTCPIGSAEFDGWFGAIR